LSVILTSLVGNNSDLIARVSDMYLKHGDTVADVTFGRGVFWKKTDLSKINFLPTDLQEGIDFSNLPYDDASIDTLILDPPYMHGGKTVKKSINKCYLNKNTSHESVVRSYALGILEASRVLKKHGAIWVKTQDEIESGKQRFTHIEIIKCLEMFGFTVIDLFVLVQEVVPAMREKYQKTARKNHSYMIIGKFKR